MEAVQWVTNIGSERDWQFKAEPNPRLNGRALPLGMGKVLGGGSSINAMIWTRGHKSDWDFFASEAEDRDRKRQSVFRSYVFPYMDRPNLTVLTHAIVTRLTFEAKRATGVEISHYGGTHRIRAGREVILSLGTIHTPKVLMQSGIGDPAKIGRPRVFDPDVALERAMHGFWAKGYESQYQALRARSSPISFRMKSCLVLQIGHMLRFDPGIESATILRLKFRPFKNAGVEYNAVSSAPSRPGNPSASWSRRLAGDRAPLHAFSTRSQRSDHRHDQSR